MITKSQRLSRAEFSHYFKIGRRYHSPTLTVVYTPHEQFHASVVVGKKVSKIAARRNTIRRRIYELLRQQSKDLTGIYIVVVKPTFNSLTRQQARQAILELVAKLLKAT